MDSRCSLDAHATMVEVTLIRSRQSLKRPFIEQLAGTKNCKLVSCEEKFFPFLKPYTPNLSAMVIVFFQMLIFLGTESRHEHDVSLLYFVIYLRILRFK